MQRQGFDESLRLEKIFSMFGIGCSTSSKVPKLKGRQSKIRNDGQKLRGVGVKLIHEYFELIKT
jgi:hypothetical protein